MILTVTLNPLLEKRFILNKLEPGKRNNAAESIYVAGGKGINVSRQLNQLGIQNQALTFVGGDAGKIFRHRLNEEGIKHSFVSINDEIRTGTLVLETEQNRVTTLFPPNPNISQKEADEFKSKLEKMIQNCSVVIFSGSSPCKTTDDIFPFGIEIANKLDKISIVDTYGSTLKKCIDAGPTVLHNNNLEISQSLGANLETEEDHKNFLKELYGKNIKLSFLTNGSKAFYCAKYDFIHKVEFKEVKQIDPTGSGDAFTAGIAYGLEKALVFNEFVTVATALGAANAASREVCNSNMEEARNYFDKISITPIGKKMKIIDDSPTI